MLSSKNIIKKYSDEFFVGICVLASFFALASSLYWPRTWILSSIGFAVVTVYLCSVLYLVMTSSKFLAFSLVFGGNFLCQVGSYFSTSYYSSCLIAAFLGSLLVYQGTVREFRSKLQIASHELDITLAALASVTVLIVGAGAIIEDWFDHDSLLGVIFFIREGLVFFSSAVMFIFLALSNHSKQPQIAKVHKISSGIRYARQKFFTVEIFPFLCLNIVGMIINGSFIYFDRYSFNQVSPDFGLLWVIFFLQMVETFYLFRVRAQKNEIGSKVISEGEQKLLERMNDDRSSYTFAVKTFIYSMDHDPLGVISQSFPASLMQIREEEIKKLLAKISKGRIIDQNTVGTKLHGAFDPEAGTCLSQEALVTVLLTYLDIGALVNRRIKGLTGILHILDPELANSMKNKEIEKIQKGTHWLFYLDFDWIDQHVVCSFDGASLSSNYEILPGAIKDSILALQNEGILVGNFLWLSESAGLKIVKEIPNLKSIVESRVIQIISTDRFKTIYFIRFEHLSPRIQGLYEIDSLRKMFLDLEPSPEAIRLIETLSRRIPLLVGSKEVLHLVKTITSFRWNGFREKDLAIVLLTHVWNELNSNTSKNFSDLDSLNRLVTHGILQIGYPSQYLHLAQIRKNSLRSISVLKNVALDVGHEQFIEAWSVLASGLLGRLKVEDSSQLLRIVRMALSYRKVRAQYIVRNRIMDIVCFVLGSLETVKNEEISQAIINVILTLGSFEMEADLLIVWVDRIQWLANQPGREILLFDEDWEKLLEMISRVGAFHGRNLSFLKARVESIRSISKIETSVPS